MKKITVVVPPQKFENIKKRMIKEGVTGITVSGCEGFGIQKRKVEALKEQDVSIEFLPKIKIDIIVKDEDSRSIIDAVVDESRTGRIGDGKIFISNVDEVVRIRTGEKNEDAL
ncbi:MAG TPA: P-II family nitrogen regulator [Firmicutes bacterium]|nr:P-II family nitrogen regulator [Bacillota bacterium]